MQNKESNRDEIDLIELFIIFWKDRRILFYSILLFIAIGILIAFTSHEEYTSRVLLLPEGRQQTAGISLAQQFGLGNLHSSSVDGLSTAFYPNIVKSNPFLLPLLDYKIYYTQTNDSLSLSSYFNDYYSDATFISNILSGIKKYTIRLPFTIAGWFNKKQSMPEIILDSHDINKSSIPNNYQTVLRINNRELRAINRLKSRITVSSDEGIISISAKMREPEMATDIVDFVTASLVDYIKNHRTEKARLDVNFIEERFEEARIRFEQSQLKLAGFRDQNRGNLTQVALSQEQRLQSEYDLSFNIYNTLARRYEEARIKLQEETPVVMVLEPAIIPSSISEPRRSLIITIYIILGSFTGFLLITIKRIFIRIRETIKQKQKK